MKYSATHNVATQLCGYICDYATTTWLYECMAMWCRGLVDGYVPIRYWIQTLLVTLLVTGS